MEPSVMTRSPVDVLPLEAEMGSSIGILHRIRPLWRYAIWLGAVFILSAWAVDIRLDVQRLRKDVDQTERHEREARVLNERLRLELDARRRASAVEVVAGALELGPEVTVVDVAVVDAAEDL